MLFWFYLLRFLWSHVLPKARIPRDFAESGKQQMKIRAINSSSHRTGILPTSAITRVIWNMLNSEHSSPMSLSSAHLSMTMLIPGTVTSLFWISSEPTLFSHVPQNQQKTILPSQSFAESGKATTGSRLFPQKECSLIRLIIRN